MLRGLTKTGFAAGMYWIGMDRMIGARRGLKNLPLVVSYHRVVPDFQASARHAISPMLVSTRTLEHQLDWIGRRYEFVSLDELALLLEGRKTSRKPVATVTFDDGYGDVYWNGFPILKKKGIPSAVFVVTDFVGTPDLQVHDELYLFLSAALSQWISPEDELCRFINSLDIYPSVANRLCRHIADPFKVTRICLESMNRSEINKLTEGMRRKIIIPEDILHEFHSLSWGMLAEMTRHGVTVGSHTKSHSLLANEDWDTVIDELKGSRHVLEQNLGIQVRHFAYPDGRFNENAVKGVAAAGFRYGYTTCLHRDPGQPLLTIPRRVLWENSCLDSFGRFSPAILSCQVNGIFDPAARCRQEHWGT